MKKIIRQILKEDRRQMFLNKIVQVMKNDFPLFKNMESYGFTEQLSEEELNYILSGIFGEPVKSYHQSGIYNENRKEIYFEDTIGDWYRKEYDENGNIIYRENSDGYWVKHEYDDNGNEIYFENSDGEWVKYEYDQDGNIIYYEDSYGMNARYRR